MNGDFRVAMDIREDDMGSLMSFMGRNVRIVVAVAVIAASVGAAGAIGWMTAPI
jgi:hypothetical protein